ncbi:ZIP zinc/iron transport family [Glonium stellatum]|uniref:ZIP zinc/iron transport family n=1 Tax=Glonium stellatum TaxID=574774 RepID=A0A8E2F4L4_9PEZI|nr:ZIP zinc/iron transport family [Glonium stellatum]
MSQSDFDPERVNLTTADAAQVVCYLNKGGNEYNGSLGARISALFVILILSTVATFFPVVAKRVPRLRIPSYVYLTARYFGSGVIVATAFIHLLDPAYQEIGPNTCVGMSGHWATYSWPPAIVLVSVMVIFLMDFAAERYVEITYGVKPSGPITHDQSVLSRENDSNGEKMVQGNEPGLATGNHQTSTPEVDIEALKIEADEYAFRQQIAAFLILEFGVIFHSVIIGLNLGVAGSEFATLYPVLVFHQSFEGLGIGARMSAIPFKKGSWLPWVLCTLYGLTTPISIAIGLGVRTTYNPGSFTANVVSGVFDSISAGILIYTGLVELLARDFLFDPERTTNNKKLTYMIVMVLLGTALMALLGKWA